MRGERPPAGDSDTAPAGTRLRPGRDRAAGPDAVSRPASRVLRAWPGLRPALPAVAFAGAGVLLFLAYLGESRTLPVNSDGAGNALEAWDMLHGNLLLHGWILTDVSFYTTELPQYMLVELARGLGADVVHVAAALTYTLLVLLAALLARGRASGRAAAARMLLAGGIMLAPTLGVDANVLLLSPDHTGTMVPLLVMWLILDRAGRRWYVPVLAGLMLTLATIADTVALLEGTVPVIIACLVRLARDRRSGPSRRFEIALAGSAAASAVTAWAAVRLIGRSGGFTAWPVPLAFARYGALEGHAVNTAKGLLVLFGADFFGERRGPNPGFYGTHPGPGVAVGALHLTGLVLAAWALGIAVRHCYRETEFVLAGLAVAVAVVIPAYLFSSLSGNFLSLRDIAGVLPMTAVLAGRLLPDRLAAGWRAGLRGAGVGRGGLRRAGPRGAGVQRPGLRWLAAAGALTVLLAAGAGYAADLAYNATRPSVPAEYQPVADWLAAHRLRYGLGGYWQANSISLESMGRIGVRAVRLRAGRVAAGQWETRASWYDPRRHDASFVVVSPGKGGLSLAALTATFGPPAHAYRVAGSTVLTWHQNLLAELARPPA